MKLCVFSTLVCLVMTVRSQSLVPCEGQPIDYTGPQLPVLPDQFQTVIEANIVQKNRTVNLMEYYDYKGNRGAILHYNRTTQQTMRTVVDFKAMEARVIYENNLCEFMNTNGSSSGFGFMSSDNGTQIKSLKELLYFGKDKGEVFIDGDKKVRGIAVNHWQTCVHIPRSDGTFTLDYYFTQGSGYIVDGKEVQVPVRAVINGTGKTMHRNGSVSDTYHSFYHIYEFIDFKPVIHDTSVFEVPVGMVCNQGNLPSDKPAPSISSQFSAGIEKVLLHNGVEQNRIGLQLYIDNSSHLLRMDLDQPISDMGRPSHGKRPTTYINDYKHGLQYVIDRLEKNCTVRNDLVSLGVQGRMMPPPIIITDFFHNFSSFIYQGQKSWRGIPVYSWAKFNSSSKQATEILFHIPQKIGPMRPGQDSMIDLEPVGIYENGPSHDTVPIKISTYEHMYGFSNGHPDSDVFDVSPCYAMDYHSTYLAVDITGSEIDEVLKFHQKEFISEVRQTIATAAKVSVTRVASIKWEEGKFDRNTRLIVTFLLLDNKLSGLQEAVYTGPSLSEAISNLQNALNSGSTLVFDVVLGTSHSARLGILQGSLYEVYAAKDTVTSATTKRYGAGAMAGLAIGMLVIGALLGLLAAYVIYRRFNTEIPYKVT